MYYKWLKWFCSSTGFHSSYKTKDHAQYARKLIKYLAQGIETREDEVYGQGFRDAMLTVTKLGFKTTLNYTLKNGTLPVAPPKTELLWKATTSGATLLLKATATTITDLLWKSTGRCYGRPSPPQLGPKP